jgi:hypothetical protein
MVGVKGYALDLVNARRLWTVTTEMVCPHL